MRLVALGAEFVAQVRERVWFAVMVSGDGGEGGCGEVGAVQAYAGEFGAQLGDLGGENGSVGKGGGQGMPDVGGKLVSQSFG
jgi:hypothetical protein